MELMDIVAIVSAMGVFGALVFNGMTLLKDKKRFWLGTLSAINPESNDSMPISLNHFTI